MPYHSTVVKRVTGGMTVGGVTAGVADYAEGSGLDKAEAAAGEILTGIFGGVPWEMTPGEIVEAVTPDFINDFVRNVVDAATGGGGQDVAGEAAGVIVPYLVDLVGVVV